MLRGVADVLEKLSVDLFWRMSRREGTWHERRRRSDRSSASDAASWQCRHSVTSHASFLASGKLAVAASQRLTTDACECFAGKKRVKNTGPKRTSFNKCDVGILIKVFSSIYGQVVWRTLTDTCSIKSRMSVCEFDNIRVSITFVLKK